MSLGKGFLAIRKAGHLCVQTLTQDYSDYSGREKLMEVRVDVLKPGLRVLIVDQWIETGGTMRAAIKLVENQGATVVGQGREPWEWNKAGGSSVNEHHLRATPVSSPMEELRKDKRRNGDRERTRPGLYVVFYHVYMWQSFVRGCRFTFVLLFVSFWN
ncbi:adenine phosphoribosyltransferase isoform X5 [Megalobrama amblycephala]|nr:adenine phosphoribosyltransferase isoform X5 [Megalobrama amblycephala]